VRYNLRRSPSTTLAGQIRNRGQICALAGQIRKAGRASGHYFETFAVVERGGLIHPPEIKKPANPDGREVKKFGVLKKTSAEQCYGGTICMCEEVIPIDAKNCFIPCNLI
jgi:hypothetical protein